MRYRLRTLLIVVSVICVGLGIWVSYHLRWIKQRQAALDWIETQSAYWDDVPIQQGAFEGHPAPWRIRTLGARGIGMVSVIVRKSEQAPKQRELERLFPEAKVYVMTIGSGYHGKHAGE